MASVRRYYQQVIAAWSESGSRGQSKGAEVASFCPLCALLSGVFDTATKLLIGLEGTAWTNDGKLNQCETGVSTLKSKPHSRSETQHRSVMHNVHNVPNDDKEAWYRIFSVGSFLKRFFGVFLLVRSLRTRYLVYHLGFTILSGRSWPSCSRSRSHSLQS